MNIDHEWSGLGILLIASPERPGDAAGGVGRLPRLNPRAGVSFKLGDDFIGHARIDIDSLGSHAAPRSDVSAMALAMAASRTSNLPSQQR